MFSSCCGCGNKKANLKVANDDDAEENNCDNENDDAITSHHTDPDENEQLDKGTSEPLNQKEPDANANPSSNGTNTLVDQTSKTNKLDNETVQCDTNNKQINLNAKCRKLSDSSNSTVIETVKLNAPQPIDTPSEIVDENRKPSVTSISSASITKSSQKRSPGICNSTGKDNSSPLKCDEEEEATINDVNDVEDEEHPLQDELLEDCLSNGGGKKSCMSSRRSSSKSSIKKRVNYSESREIIPPPSLENGFYDVAGNINNPTDDDEVFSDSVPAKFLRGDMCTPYPKKRSSIPGVFSLPDWFADDREIGGVLEPPVTPVGRDELALKRHRFFSDLLTAAQQAAEHRVRFDPFGPNVADCPDLKASNTAELTNLINRLERICERLERAVSAHALETANQQLNTNIQTNQTTKTNQTNRNSDEIDNLPLPSLPTTPCSTQSIPQESITTLEADEIFSSNNNIENYCDLATPTPPPPLSSTSTDITATPDDLDLNIPTVVAQLEDAILFNEQSPADYTPPKTMSVYGFQDILSGPFAQYLQLSAKIGGDVATHANVVKKAFDAQLEYVTLASTSSKPAQGRQLELLKPTSDQITAIQEFREKNRSSPFFNHLSAISESIPALGWVCVSPTPGPHVKEMNDAGQFYTNRVLKDWKEKNATHVEWARAWVQTLTELQQYIKQYHTTGLVWSGKTEVPARAGGAPPPPPPCCPPPPPVLPPIGDLGLDGNDERSALFAQINQGEDITKSLKRVTADMQTHKNTALRTGPAPFKAPTASATAAAPKAPAAAATKAPVFNRDGKKWLIEYQKSNPNLIVENAEMNNVVYAFKCENSTITVKGKINSIFLDSCKKCSVLFDAVVSSIEFVNCQSVQMQVLGHVPTISIDKTDGCQMYLSEEAKNVEIVSSKSSEMNVLLLKSNGDYTELPIPEQFKTTIRGNNLSTICVESLG